MPLGLDVTSIIIIIACLIVSLVLHEMMHAYVGLKLGDTTAQGEGRISLNPLNHIDPFMTILLPIITVAIFHVPILVAKPVPLDPRNLKYDEYGAAMVAAAGPLTNLMLAVVGAIVLGLAGGGLLHDILLTFTILNVALFVFNLVPIPPLDGSRVLYAIAPEPVQEFMARLDNGLGLMVVFGLVILVPEFGQVLVNVNTGITNFLIQTL